MKIYRSRRQRDHRFKAATDGAGRLKLSRRGKVKLTYLSGSGNAPGSMELSPGALGRWGERVEE